MYCIDIHSIASYSIFTVSVFVFAVFPFRCFKCRHFPFRCFPTFSSTFLPFDIFLFDVFRQFVCDNTEKTDTLVTDSNAPCTPIGSVALITEISNKLTPMSLEH